MRTPDGNGYWILTANGTVYSYGDAANDGDAKGPNRNGPSEFLARYSNCNCNSRMNMLAR